MLGIIICATVGIVIAVVGASLIYAAFDSGDNEPVIPGFLILGLGLSILFLTFQEARSVPDKEGFKGQVRIVK